MAAIEAEGLRRTYKTHTGTVRRKAKEIEAVRGIDFQVREGELFGLLGPNGAGKTTLVKVLATLLAPARGTARVLGHDVVRDPFAVRLRIGLAGQFAAVDENLTGAENLRLVGKLTPSTALVSPKCLTRSIASTAGAWVMGQP